MQTDTILSGVTGMNPDAEEFQGGEQAHMLLEALDRFFVAYGEVFGTSIFEPLLQRRTGLTERQVIRAFREMERAGLIERSGNRFTPTAKFAQRYLLTSSTTA